MIPVNRSVEYYRKYNQDYSEGGELIGKYDVSEIPLRYLKAIVTPKEDDIFLYELYDLNETQLNEINRRLKEPFSFSLDKFDYCLACTAIKGYYDSHKIRGKRSGGYPAPDLG